MDEKLLHYQDLARYYRNRTIALECTAAILVEYKEDKIFWKRIFEAFCPQHSFEFFAGVRSMKENITYGTGQMFKFHEYQLLSKHFILAIDSEYCYILQQNAVSVQDFILQTYAHSKENYHIYPKEIAKVYGQYEQDATKIFDFEAFLDTYSACVYELFVTFLYSIFKEDKKVNADDFYKCIALSNPPDIQNQAQTEIEKVITNVATFLTNLNLSYTKKELQAFENQLINAGLTKDNVYWFLRGHNIFDEIITRIGNKMGYEIPIGRQGKVSNFRQKINNRIVFGNYFPLTKIKSDIKTLFP